MALRINTNLVALGASNQLEQTTQRLGAHIRRIGSGLRINQAAEDPQGMGRSERLRVRIRSTTTAIHNAEEAAGLVRTMESGLARMSEIGVRIKGLALQASNGTSSKLDIQPLDAERLQLAK